MSKLRLTLVAIKVRSFGIVLAALLLVQVHQSLAQSPCQKDFEAIYRDTVRSVVQVHSLRIDPMGIVERVKKGFGTGIVIGGGFVVTAAHVVWQANSLRIVAGDSSRNATIVGIDPITDIAILRAADSMAGIPPIAWGQSDTLVVGQDVLAIGHPIGLINSATRGVISGTGRILPTSPLSWLAPLIQTDAVLLPGSSGGPLVNRCGMVVGVNSLILGPQPSISFAVPSELVGETAAEIIKNTKVSRPWHGIRGTVITVSLSELLSDTYAVPVRNGFLVETVDPNSPAAKAGVKGGTMVGSIDGKDFIIGGDIITSVNDEIIDSVEQAIKIAKSMKVGQSASVDLMDRKARRTVNFLIAERPLLPSDVARYDQKTKR